jgi:N-acetyl-anhydromuramyl-L-alanine amidase AmpD
MITGCSLPKRSGTPLTRRGDEIIAAGQLFHTGTKVITWMDPGGYDAYRVERRFAPFDQSSWETSKVAVAALKTPNRYGLRKDGLTDAEIERVRGGGWDLKLLQKKVDQFVYHFDVAGTSRQCFRVLHDARCLSVHFMVDIDGTIYQTLDLKERAWHATTSNTRSIGIEIANMGAYSSPTNKDLMSWYKQDPDGRTRISIPERLGDGGVHTKDFIGRPARNEPIFGVIQGTKLYQYDLTNEQYDALIRLTATLCKVFPKIRCDYPRDEKGQLIPGVLSEEKLESYQGLIGHYHIQKNKTDPGPAFDWSRIVEGARGKMKP